MVPGQLIELVAGVYGLIDGPAHWRGTFKEYLTGSLQYRQSRLDPTVFSLYFEERLEGLIIVEIDDILSFGYAEHDRRLSALRERFKFGKFKYLQDLREGTTFNGRRIRQDKDGTISVDMGKYVEERMAPISIERGRRSQPDSPVTEEERQKARGAIGSIAWAAKEGRPDLAAPASILASRMKTMKVKDLVEINRAIQNAKAKRDLTLKYFPIPPDKLGWARSRMHRGLTTRMAPPKVRWRSWPSTRSCWKASRQLAPSCGGNPESCGGRSARLWQRKLSP